jgi:UDP-glucuronate 4-epimerase
MYIITGCCGFIGSHLALFLLQKGYIVIGVDIMNDFYPVAQKMQNLNLCVKYDNFRFVKGDILCDSTYHRIDEICHCIGRSPICVVHLAALAGVRPSLDRPHDYMRVNVEGTTKVLEYCRERMIRHFFYASSSSVYGLNEKVPFSESDPVDKQNSPYAVSKLCCENIAKLYSNLYGMNVCGFRFFTVYGERGRPDMAPYKFAKAIMEGREIEIYGDGNSYRDYTYVGDIVELIYAAVNILIANGRFCEIYNIGRGEPVYLLDFIVKMEQIIGRQANLRFVDEQKGDVPATFADTSKIQSLTGVAPKISTEEGLRRMIYWMQHETT